MLLTDGFSTLYSFAAVPSVMFEEKTVTPPSIEGGGEVDSTTMRNNRWRTRQPRKLLTMGESTITVAYDPAIYDDIVDLMQVNNEITVTFPDGSTLVFWGWVDSFTPGELAEGESPEADITIICSNQNNEGVETAPVHTPSAVTTTA